MWFVGDGYIFEEIRRLVKDELRFLRKISELLEQIRSFFPLIPTGVSVVQIQGEDNMPGAGSNNINQGGSGVFQAQPVPAGSSFPSGTQFAWSSDDSQITFTPVASDPSGATVTATDAAGDPATTAKIAVAVQLPGTPAPPVLTGSDPITITPVAPPPPTGVSVVQLS